MTYVIDAKTPKGQAGQMLRAGNAEATAVGMHKTAILRKESIKRSDYKRVNHYVVVWEDGPYEWGIIGGGGGAIWNEEMGWNAYLNRDGSFVTPTFEFADHVRFDHNYSFDFTFYPGW